MIRQKRRQLLITFDSTTQAMKMEAEAKKQGFPGRIIPLPSEVSSGCGLAWKTELSNKEEALVFLKKMEIRWENFIEMDLI